MAFAIERRAPFNGTNFHFLPHFFSFASEPYLYETDFTPGPIVP